MTEARVPAGVPTGGQFATSAKAESDVSLDAGQAAEDRLAAINEALKATLALRDLLDTFADDLDDAVLVVEIAGEFPDAAKIGVSDYDDGNGPDAYLHVYDADGSLLDERISSFRPSRVDDDNNYVIDVAQVRALDVEARTAALRHQIAGTAAAPAASAGPETNHEHAVYSEWLRQTSNGHPDGMDHMSFRDWYTARHEGSSR